MNSSKKTTIRKELFRSSIFFSATIILIFSILLSSMLYYSGLSNAYAVIRQKNQAVNFFIDGYFTKIHNTVEFLASNKKVQNAPWLDMKSCAEVLSLYRSLEISDPDIKYIYSGYENGLLLINHYTPPKGFNPLIRPWYQAALESAPNISGGVPYQEIKSKKWLVSISKVLFNDKKQRSGVVSIDCSINKVANLLKEPGYKYKSSYSFVLKPDGTILIYHEKSFLKKNIADVVKQPVSFDKKEGDFSFELNDVDELAYYSRIDKLGWIIVTVVNKKEIISPIILRIVIAVSVIGFFAILIAWLLSASLSKRFVEPLIALKKRVNVIISGESDYDTLYKYPDNEIGTIAEDIEQLTEHELYNKNIELQNINKQLELLSTTDQLTKLLNRRKMNEELQKEWKRAKRYGNKFCVIMYDIDWFKKINDSYGHQAGDRVLFELSELTKKTLRKTDIVSRWGGEEFLILSPEISLDEAKTLANKLCKSVANHNFSVDTRVTISIGVSVFDGEKQIEEMIKEADEKLYEAKRQGRNRVVV